ncbi:MULTISPECIES: DUF6343 family protein [Streptomyces]|uniref:Uncharacterized protein n=2 Tax=Streptomyces TaxID=1883 RepID=A0A2N8PLB6_STRNR|nr:MULTISPECIES: DUF6343 family protein [Streptomyces]PNE41826.1 hypothetical protein AOB60_14620 [Streptomyces noursei]SHL94057.1 hypothetical protein SAMN05216268_107166 [Streptomyces yunnanensis]
MRSGDEPLHARSPLRIRCGLALWGLLWAVAGTVAFVMAGRPQWAAACAALAAVAAADLIMVIRHIRQGPHYQPGRNIPPYEPDRGRNEIRRAAGRRRDSRP